MNLGQLIDPEWVQQGYPERFPRRARAPEELRRVVMSDGVQSVLPHSVATPTAPARAPRGEGPRRAYGSVRSILLIVNELGEVAMADVRSRMPGASVHLSTVLGQLAKRGDLKRIEGHYPHRFRLTDQGRARVL